MTQALIVIDVQESFRKRPYWRASEAPAFLKNVQSLVDLARARGIPIAQVFHQELNDDPADPFSRSSGFVRAMPELTLRPDAVFHKHVHSAMFGKTADGITLDDWLRQQGRGRGPDHRHPNGAMLRDHDEARLGLGFKVRYVTDATLTFPMRSRLGTRILAAEIRERTELVLDGRFAQVVSAAEALRQSTSEPRSTHDERGCFRSAAAGGAARSGRTRGCFSNANQKVPDSYRLRFVAPTGSLQSSVGLQLGELEPLPAQLPDGAIVVIAGITGNHTARRAGDRSRDPWSLPVDQERDCWFACVPAV